MDRAGIAKLSEKLEGDGVEGYEKGAGSARQAGASDADVRCPVIVARSGAPSYTHAYTVAGQRDVLAVMENALDAVGEAVVGARLGRVMSNSIHNTDNLVQRIIVAQIIAHAGCAFYSRAWGHRCVRVYREWTRRGQERGRVVSAVYNDDIDAVGGAGVARFRRWGK